MSNTIIHTADWHIGSTSSQSEKKDALGHNIREWDFIHSVDELVDDVIAEKPKVFIVAGDVFDSSRPTNAMVKEVIRMLNKLEEAHIRTIIGSGNHDISNVLTTTGALHSLAEIEYQYITIIHEDVAHIQVDDLEVIVVPHASLIRGFTPEDIAPRTDKSVLVLHGVAEGSEIYSQVDEQREKPLSSYIFKQNYEYIALGHYHKRSKVAERAYYSGSLDNKSFGPDMQAVKGALRIDLDAVRQPDWEPEIIEIHSRKMIDLPCVEVDGCDGSQVIKKVAAAFAGIDITDAMVRLTVKNINKDVLKTLNRKEIDKMASDAFSFKAIYKAKQIVVDENGEADETSGVDIGINEIESELGVAVDRYYTLNPEVTADKDRVLNTGIAYLREAQEKRAGKE